MTRSNHAGALRRHARRRVPLALVALVAATAALTGSLATSASAATSLTIGQFSIPAPGTKPVVGTVLGYGIDQGGGKVQSIFKKYGFDLKPVVGFGINEDALAALASGSVQIACCNEVAHIQFRASGKKTRAAFVAKPSGLLYIVTRGNDVKDVNDLKGKVIGVPFHTHLERYVRQVLGHKGANIINQVTLRNVPPAGWASALFGGSVSALVLGDATIEQFKQRDSSVRVLYNNKKFSGSNAAVFSVQESFLKKNPKLQPALLEAHKWSDALARKNPEKYYQWYATVSNSSLAAAKRSLGKLTKVTASVDPAGFKSLESTYAFLKASKLISKPFDLRKWVVSGKKK